MTVALKGTDFAKSFEMTVRSADKTALNEVIAEAGSDEFEAAFDAAKKVAADEDATPAQVDATEPSGLSKTGASTMAFAVAAVLLLAAGAGVVLLRRCAE